MKTEYFHNCCYLTKHTLFITHVTYLLTVHIISFHSNLHHTTKKISQVA